MGLEKAVKGPQAMSAGVGMVLAGGVLLAAVQALGQAAGGPGSTSVANTGYSTSQINQAQQQLNSGSVSGGQDRKSVV